MREIILDTETTGLEHKEGHKIIEIGALEMVDRVLTGEQFHVYINPERPIDAGAMKVHGITDEKVANEPIFADIAQKFLNFIGTGSLVIHNAPFDMGFINAELEACGYNEISNDLVIDTLLLARQKFPGGRARLDDLCKRFNIDNSHRDLHGALVDADLLAEVYVELMGGRQTAFTFAEKENLNENNSRESNIEALSSVSSSVKKRPKRDHSPTAEEDFAHQEFLLKIKDPLWLKS